MHILDASGATVAALAVAAVALLIVTVPGAVAPTFRTDVPSPLVVRVAIFAADQDRLERYRDFIDGHLFPTLRTVPGYVGTLLGRDPQTGQLISLSLWRTEADAVAGENAVGRAIRQLPPGSAPRPSVVERYVIEYRDIKESLLR